MATIQITHDSGIPTIAVHGAFVFELNREFRDTYQALPANRPVVVDLSRADYMDSAGLGMLIRLREHAGNSNDAVTLKGANPTVRQILEVANFGHLFRLA
jgi:anti-anti-sigma factor